MTLLADTVCMSVNVEHYICYDIHMLDDSHSGSLIFFFSQFKVKDLNLSLKEMK